MTKRTGSILCVGQFPFDSREVNVTCIEGVDCLNIFQHVRQFGLIIGGQDS